MNDAIFIFTPTIGLVVFFLVMNVVIARIFLRIETEDD